MIANSQHGYRVVRFDGGTIGRSTPDSQASMRDEAEGGRSKTALDSQILWGAIMDIAKADTADPPDKSGKDKEGSEGVEEQEQA